MNQKNNLPLYLGIAVAAGVIIGSFFNIKNGGKSYAFQGNNSPEVEKLNTVIGLIKDNYVDEVNTVEIVDGLVQNIVDQLDPHSTYLSKDMQQHAAETMNGNFEGIGVQFVKKKDTVMVVKVIPDGPSMKAGIKAGDRLLIADKDTLYDKDLKNRDIVSKLKGPADSQVLIKVFRPGAKNLIDFNITRAKVAIKSVPVAYAINDSIGYVKLIRFAMTSAREVQTVLKKFKADGIENIILDLRGNPGGFIHIADKIADQFLKNGDMIVYTKNKKGRQRNSVATSKGIFESGKVYVLVDENSASASEIIAGALQDNDRATILGRRTFGKGLVQQEMGFEDGSAMRLTIARYYTPTGRSIQKAYDKKNGTDYSDEVMGRYLSGELFHKDSIKIDTTKQFKTPKGKLVYGGGGIVPDEFIPLDTLNQISYLNYNLIDNYVFDYVDKNRAALLKYNNNNFDAAFIVTNKMVDGLNKLSSPFVFEKTDQVKALIKQNFASNLLGDEMYYRMLHKKDVFIQKVLTLDQDQ